jgi:hypothetical protein
VPHQPAPKVHITPVPESRTQRSEERDTLNDTPELRFLRDEIEALLGSASVQRAVHTPAINYGADHETEAEASPSAARAEPELDGAMFERDTEPSVDAKLLREALRAAGK